MTAESLVIGQPERVRKRLQMASKATRFNHRNTGCKRSRASQRLWSRMANPRTGRSVLLKWDAGNVTGFNQSMQTIIFITALGVVTLALIRLAIAATDTAWPAERIAGFDGVSGGRHRVRQPESKYGSRIPTAGVVSAGG